MGVPLLGVSSSLHKEDELLGASSSAPAVMLRGAARRYLALCLVGIAGVAGGHASGMNLSPDAAHAAAASHVRHLLLPAEAQGVTTHVFAHSWSANSTAVVRAVDAAYGERFCASRHEQLGRFTSERVTSLTLSINACLQLARRHAMRLGLSYDLIVVARHDLLFLRDVDLLLASPRALTLSPWCLFQGAPEESACGALNAPPASGVLDSFFIGSQTLLEWFFGALQLARLRRLQLVDASRQTDRLTVPSHALRSDGTLHGPERKGGYAHMAIEALIQQLGLRERKLLHTHPHAIELVHFVRFGARHLKLKVSELEANRSAAELCNGRRLCMMPRKTNRAPSL